MAEELKRAIQKRASTKAQLTRFKTYLAGVPSDEGIVKIQIRLEKAEGLWDSFLDAQTEIEALDEGNTDHSKERIAFEDAYYDIISQAKQMIADRTIPATNSTSTCTSPTSDSQPVLHIKLPTLNLPKFSGMYDQWLQFYDTFSSLIHTNTALTNIQKFHYLRSSLKNEAAQVISSLDVTAANYENAWSLLRERFENKRLIIHNHVRAIFELAPIAKESHVALRQLVDNMLKHIRALQSLKQPTEHWDTLIIHLMSTKLDSVTEREWETSLTDTNTPTLEQMTGFLATRAQVLETLYTSSAAHKQQVKIIPIVNKPRNKEHTASYVTTQQTGCKLCKKSHALYTCEEFLKLPVSSRVKEVKGLRLCINYLRPGHFSKDCNSSHCKRCTKKHNTLLHVEESAPTHSNQEPQDTQHQTGASVTTHCTHKHESHVLLSTALVYIHDRQGKPHKCRALLDSGSQSNFITEDLYNSSFLQSR